MVCTTSSRMVYGPYLRFCSVAQQPQYAQPPSVPRTHTVHKQDDWLGAWQVALIHWRQTRYDVTPAAPVPLWPAAVWAMQTITTTGGGGNFRTGFISHSGLVA